MALDPQSQVFVMPDSYFEADIESTTIRLPTTTQRPTRFHSRAPPNISVNDYLLRVARYASMEPACMLIILIYVDRICERNPTFTISSLTVHRFIIAAGTVAIKTLCDAYCTNLHYAKVGGISLHELNALEVELLDMMGWHLVATQEQLDPKSVLQTDLVAAQKLGMQQQSVQQL
ncbi:cyclin-domain-containing protein [Linderina pennispora]|uniref:Cyclin-domain-containing protein n=1 Tax=Linderina pennispora TaxID=61395 RepID=A0A1Y1WM09_9FUNG|nr:cyclin-domain-containing protein [Linderina pennispora]ORX74134.1 cyclin-domain-containing protein [Linderina pennispora]